MKKTAFVLGYAGSILAFAFSVLMILIVPLGLAGDILDDMTRDLNAESIVALNETALEMKEQDWSDYSRNGIIEAAEQTAEKSDLNIDEDVYTDAAKFAYDAGFNAMVSMIVVGAAIILSLIGLIGTMIVKKAPVAGGVLLLVSAFFILLAAIYTDTLVPTFIASVVLALGGVAALLPARMNRPVPVSAQGAQPYTARPMAPPQGGYPVYAPPQATPQDFGYAPPQAAPPVYGYVPPQAMPTPGPGNSASVRGSAPDQPASGAGDGLPFPEEPQKNKDGEA